MKPFGDRPDDGAIQLSFTLPMEASPHAREAARQFLVKMGFERVLITHMESVGEGFSYFVAYGNTTHEVDAKAVTVPELKNPVMSFAEINSFISGKIRRKVVVVGACIGSDAHTVGIDAIFNMKGFNHDWGFERYPQMRAVNLRAQVDPKHLVEKIIELKADAVLISRVITQRDEHIAEFKKFFDEIARAEGVQPQLIKICGGPRITHADALKWGFDAGFGPGTKPSEVGSFIAHELVKRL